MTSLKLNQDAALMNSITMSVSNQQIPQKLAQTKKKDSSVQKKNRKKARNRENSFLFNSLKELKM